MKHFDTGPSALFRSKVTICLFAVLVGCSSQPTIDHTIQSFAGGMPVDLSGSWERDYSRSDDVQAVLNSMLRRISRPAPDPSFTTNRRTGRPMPPAPTQDLSKVVALARLAELITRPDVLTITQNEYEISIARKDDFAMLCEFYDGYAKRTESDYGTEVCSWNNHQLVSHLILPDGLLVSHRFSMAADGMSLHVATTISSSATRTPFTVNRVYAKFDAPESDFNCVETLSMKRVCSTGEILP
ncbi:MAG: hypothetical protein ACR2QT_07355 [Woeseiaceae bacterium]